MEKEPHKELTEIEQMELERKMVNLAFENSYLVLATGTRLEDFMHDNYREGRNAVLAHDPNGNLTVKEVQDIIDYFEDKQEYEKCAVLLQVLKSL